MKWPVALVLASILTLCIPLPAAGQDSPDALSAARAAIAQVSTAGWSSASAHGVTVRVRRAPIASKAVLDAVKASDELPADVRAPLLEIATVELSEASYLINARLPPGRYSLGMEPQDDYEEFVLRNASGVVVGREPYWVTVPSDELPSVSVVSSSGATTFTLNVGGITFSWRCVSAKQHDALLPTKHVVNAGRVTLASSIDAPSELKSLAEACDAAVDVHAALLGVAVSKEPYELCLLDTAEEFDRLDNLLTGGEFKSHRAFSSHLTRRTYMQYAVLHGPEALADLGFTRRTEEVMLHELHHLVAYGGGRFHGVSTFLEEGLAEFGVWKSLEKRSPAAADAFLARAEGLWQLAVARGREPLAADLMGGDNGGDLSVWYAGAFLLVRHLDQIKADRLTLVCRVLSVQPVESRVVERTTAALASIFGPAAEAYRGAFDPLRRSPPKVAMQYGHTDLIDGGWRFTSGANAAARVMDPTPVKGPDVTLTGEFAWHPNQGSQVDFFFGFRRAKYGDGFLKVSVMPKRIALMRFADGKWSTLSGYDYDSALATGTLDEPIWHPITVHLDAEKRTVRVDTTGGRWTRFKIDYAIDTHDCLTGAGCFDGIAWVRNFQAK